MLERFRNLALSVVRRANVIKALRSSSASPLLLSNGASGSPASQRPPVSMEYLSKLQSEYIQKLNRINSVTDRMNPRQRSLWASLATDEYFELIFKAHEIYSKLIPYWDPTMLPSFGWHATHRAVRSKVVYRIVDLPNLLEYTRNLRGSKAATLLSLLQEELDDDAYREITNRPALLSLLRDLSDESGELPGSFWLTNVKRSSRRAYGGDQEVWVGSHAGQEVAVREFYYPSEMSHEQLQKIIRREIITNRQLNHPNVLKLIGVFSEDAAPMSVVTPWMANGMALAYLESHPVELLHILHGVIDGLFYLHSHNSPIIHGEVHPRNILVNADGDAVIRDLGINRVRMEVAHSLDERRRGFSPSYQAPEIMSPTAEESTSITPASDIYGLAMTFYHLVTRIQPFSPHLTTPTDVLRAVLAGDRPTLPPPEEYTSEMAYGNIYDEDLVELWGILREMWAGDAAMRPTAAQVHKKLMVLANREACQQCIDAHRPGDFRLGNVYDLPTMLNAPAVEDGGVQCTPRDNSSMNGGRGYGLDQMNRTRAENGYYITTLELPPSPEGGNASATMDLNSQVLEPRRIRLVPFTWQRRRRTSAQTSTPP